MRTRIAAIDPSIDPSASTDDGAPASAFRSNARLCPPDDMMRILWGVAAASRVAVLVDVDALERRALVKADRVALLALDALSHADVQVVLLSQGDGERAALIHRGVPRSWWFDRRCGWRDDRKDPTPGDRLPGDLLIEAPRALALVRERTLDASLIVIGDDPAWFDALAERDRGIQLARGTHARPSANIAVSGEASARAALWWLVDLRARVAAPP